MRLIVAGAVALAACAACGGDGAESTGTGDLTVFAAASLTDAFTELGDAFADVHPGAEVTFNFAGSSELATQIVEGAPADVFASADWNNMAKLTDDGHTAGDAAVFATNRAEIVVEAGNPRGILSVEDLADPELTVISCAPEVPCGRYTQQILENAGVRVPFRSFEENVRGVVSKVTIGEADAGIVYVTDVINAGDAVDGVAIPDNINVVAEYPIAVTAEAHNPSGARAFTDFVLSPEGQKILASFGFAAP